MSSDSEPMSILSDVPVHEPVVEPEIKEPVLEPVKVLEPEAINEAVKEPVLESKENKFTIDIKNYIDSHKTDFTPQVLTIVSAISENKTFLDNVEKLFDKIVADKKLNALDIPLIVILLQEMFLLFQNATFTFHDYTAVLKMLILVLVSENVDGKLTPSEQALNMNTIDAILECCIQLVEWKEKNPSVNKFCCF